MHMAWALASSKLTGNEEPAYSRLGLTKPSKELPLQREEVPLLASELPLPIFVPLASFARYRRDLPNNAPARDKTLAFYITQHLIGKQAEFSLADDFFVQLLKDGRNVILLLDGLDEVANEDERAAVREAVEELVRGREALRVVVTCRSIAYQSSRTALGADFREIAVQPLDREQHIAPMIRQAYACIYPLDAAKRDVRSDDLLRGIDRLEGDRRQRLGKDALAFVDSPLMVRLLLIVHFNERTLPDERADLFNKSINALLQVDYGLEETERRELAADWPTYRDMAQHLAFHMHSQGRDQGREIGEKKLKLVLQEEDEFKPHLEEFLRQARQRGSLLEEREGVGYRFIHLAFQEFLVARHMREVVGAKTGWQAILGFLEHRLDDPWWREPILLLVGYMSTCAAKSAREFIVALKKSGRTADMKFYAAELAGMAALEWHDSGAALELECARRIVELLNDKDALKKSQPSLRVRVGDRLAQLADPRFAPDRYYLPNDDKLGFLLIQADKSFMIGIRKQDAQRMRKVIGSGVSDDEINNETTPTGEFYIARYPVTVAQFRAFVEATGFKLGESENAICDPENRPVRWISWHEALAYCNWLNEALKTSPALESWEIAQLVRSGQWRVSLPSELEWEKSARGGLVGMIFPWGDNLDPKWANYADSKIGDTSAVGCFPPNGYGLYDMVGNVWEWTRSHYRAYPYQPNDGREEASKSGPRVLRGGAFNYNSRYARCSARYCHHPDARDGIIGFRVVLSPTLSER